MSKRFQKRNKLLAVLTAIAAVAGAIAFQFAPSRNERHLSELEACKKQCAPLAGAMEGKRRFPDAPATDRRNYSSHAQCTCR